MERKKYKVLGFPILEIEKNEDTVNAHIFCKIFHRKKNLPSVKLTNNIPTQDDSILSIGLQEGGGLGDSLFQLIYLKELRKIINCPLKLDFFSKTVSAFQNIPFIDNVFPYISDNPKKKDYDIWITARRVWCIDTNNSPKVKRLAPDFFTFCEKNQNLIKTIFENDISNNKVSQYALLLNKNRFEQTNLFNLLPVDRNTIKYMNWDLNAFSLLTKYHLKPNKYITICRAVDSRYNSNHPKLWPLKNYNELISLFKKKYPNIVVVQIGSDEQFGLFEGTDINLVGKTSLDEVKVILKYSLLHIDGEGGLVHLNKCLGGKSLVLFGPTLPEIYGYDENINIHIPTCPVSCCQLVNSWKDKCIRYKEALCISKITPNLVFEKIKKYLFDQSIFKYTCKEISYHKLLSYIGKAKNIAVFSQPSKEEIEELKKTNSFTIFDNSFPHNKNVYEYFKKIQEIGGNAEYAFQYNIPVKTGTYDLVLFPKLEDNYIDYAIYEGLRILKKDGVLIVKNSQNFKTTFIENFNIAKNSEYIYIKKEIKNA